MPNQAGVEQQPLDVRRDGAVAILTLNRPDAGNAIDVAMGNALHEAADQLHQDQSHQDQVRVVLLRARGNLFSGGGDVRASSAAVEIGPEHASSMMDELVSGFHRALKRLMEVDAPLVVAAQDRRRVPA